VLAAWLSSLSNQLSPGHFNLKVDNKPSMLWLTALVMALIIYFDRFEFDLQSLIIWYQP
jgi:hypothetical protein